MKNLLISAAVIGGLVGSAGYASAATNFVVSYEGEAAGVETTTATFSTGGVETFDSLATGTSLQSYTTNFGTSGVGSTITGTYAAGGSGIQINAANEFGGAGGTGNYAVAFQNTPYSLTLSSDIKGGVNYFGYWLSALDAGNFVTFYNAAGNVIFTFNPQDVINAVNLSANPSLYYGNPNGNYAGQDKPEAFIFVNFFDTTGSFSKISFTESGTGGYESDNHTVGHYVGMGLGTIIPLPHSIPAAPEPATWAMLIAGFASLGFLKMRRNRRIAAA